MTAAYGGLRSQWVGYCQQRQKGYITQEKLHDLYKDVCLLYSLNHEDSIFWYFRRKQMEEELMQCHRKDYTITPHIRLPDTHRSTP